MKILLDFLFKTVDYFLGKLYFKIFIGNIIRTKPEPNPNFS